MSDTRAERDNHVSYLPLYIYYVYISRDFRKCLPECSKLQKNDSLLFYLYAGSVVDLAVALNKQLTVTNQLLAISFWLLSDILNGFFVFL